MDEVDHGTITDKQEEAGMKYGVRDLLEAAPDAMVIVEAEGKIVMVNGQTEELFGYPREELVGQRVETLVPDCLRESHSSHRFEYAANPHVRSMGMGLELYGQRKDGSQFPVDISLSPLHTQDGTFVLSAIRDITEWRRAEQDASLFRAVVESSQDAIISKDLSDVITTWNAGAERLYGYTADEAKGKSITMLVPPGLDDDMPEILRRVHSGEQIDNYETIRARKDGTQVHVSLTVSPVCDRDGQLTGASVIARDISTRLRYQEQLRYLADHDALTGLLNRRQFEREVSEQVGRAHRYGELSTLLMIDIDGFKKINDTYGHRVGDRALKAIAVALKRRLRDTDQVARVGGDEFAVLLPYAGAEQGGDIAADLQRLISGCSVEVEDSEVHLSMSIGLVQIDSDTKDDESVFIEADKLMYEDKRQAKARD
jgi:diguanylate cyclase (GGDEF)-like protein/PAS domain S-box-containing protein